MMHETLKKLTDKDLAKVCGGQIYIYCAFDEKQKKKKYYIPREDGILIIYNETKIEEQYGDRVIRHCSTCNIINCSSTEEAAAKAAARAQELSDACSALRDFFYYDFPF